ncbi:AAA family ATPase [Paenibacillus lemnae]|uniref:AAA family ATPase n=1 Tax=Paenibacillus lemnae TaxID=1330551 RepID=A0A848M8S6_PAELE|nr:AAA family ATPase [Paenibacillus lemnae]NMO96590.1 AAA family ATPase [Paenibacillus lemnae]
MIIWINGAFGAGKSQTANELHRRLPQSFIFDPENAGYYIRSNLPQEIKTPDFQDYAMWRQFNYEMLKHMDTHYNGIIIVPMTIVSPKYFEQIVGRLRSGGCTVHHFALWVSKENLLKRLQKRGDSRHSWPAQQIDRCLEGLSQSVFERHLDTNNMTIDEVVENIAAELNLELILI